MPDERRARLLALYLPQFHPIPENDTWWEPGFTEWTNVSRARPLYAGHLQPRLPGELGFYDLRVPEVRAAQAALAQTHGIEAFCYWHYWFAGRRLLERPFDEVLHTQTPDFPFCLAWANQTWSGIWHGAPGRVLIEQTYPGDNDHRAHFAALLPAFADRRYVRVDGRPVFFVYRPAQLPEPQRFAALWRDLARQHGLGGLFLVGQHEADWDPIANGFDARVPLEMPKWRPPDTSTPLGRVARRLRRAVRPRPLDEGPAVLDYATVFRNVYEGRLAPHEFPLVMSNWDNTPRCGRRGSVLANSTPEAFAAYLRRAIAQVRDRPLDQRLVMIRSWNEWAEGNYLEPDQKFGRGYLEAIQRVLKE